LKEGIKGRDKFEVLKQILNPNTGKTEYKVKDDKNKIWHNRYYEEGSKSNRE
tara:strand:+ start:58327 stop:58482 length:156 start_codon:yes stop_codon:yes gene_type:complete